MTRAKTKAAGGCATQCSRTKIDAAEAALPRAASKRSKAEEGVNGGLGVDTAAAAAVKPPKGGRADLTPPGVLEALVPPTAAGNGDADNDGGGDGDAADGGGMGNAALSGGGDGNAAQSGGGDGNAAECGGGDGNAAAEDAADGGGMGNAANGGVVGNAAEGGGDGDTADGGGDGDAADAGSTGNAADGNPPAFATFGLDPNRALAMLLHRAGVVCARSATELITLTAADPAASFQQLNDSVREQRTHHRARATRFRTAAATFQKAPLLACAQRWSVLAQ